MGAMMTYGSYLSEKDDVVNASYMVAFLDTVIAIFALVAVFANVAVFAVSTLRFATFVVDVTLIGAVPFATFDTVKDNIDFIRDIYKDRIKLYFNGVIGVERKVSG